MSVFCDDNERGVVSGVVWCWTLLCQAFEKEIGKEMWDFFPLCITVL